MPAPPEERSLRCAEFRLDYVHTRAKNNPKLDTSDLVTVLIANGLNRRLMLEVVGNYQWNNGPKDTDGAGGGAQVRPRRSGAV